VKSANRRTVHSLLTNNVAGIKSVLSDGMMQLRARLLLHNRLVQLVSQKRGLEIGGPSDLFRPSGLIPIYQLAGSLDNCDFSSTTKWSTHSSAFSYREDKSPGKTFFLDGSKLSSIPDNSYDFVLSCHNLEHFANPVKALREWMRILHPGGTLVVIVPFYRKTFDHRRAPTTVEHMLHDFETDVGEDDLTHLDEVLALHDLEMDPRAGTIEEFSKRSRSNFLNRCLHHHVFNRDNVRDLLTAVGWEPALIQQLGVHVCAIATSLKQA